MAWQLATRRAAALEGDGPRLVDATYGLPTGYVGGADRIGLTFPGCVAPRQDDKLMTELIHLICGSTGAGKTTYARQLTERIRGVRFSIDDWMMRLFWMDSPRPIRPDWSLERVERCQALIWTTASCTAKRGVPAVLDLGLAQAASRKTFVGLAQEAGLSVRLHFLDVPLHERWRRVRSRNVDNDNPDRLPFEITREMFDFVETLWEPPTDAELSGSVPVTIGPADHSP